MSWSNHRPLATGVPRPPRPDAVLGVREPDPGLRSCRTTSSPVSHICTAPLHDIAISVAQDVLEFLVVKDFGFGQPSNGTKVWDAWQYGNHCATILGSVGKENTALQTKGVT